MLYDFNYNPVHQCIRKDIQQWSTYPLDLSNRVLMVKMTIPRLLYLFQSLPTNIPFKQFIEWDILSKFVWDGKKAKVMYSTLQLQKDKGVWPFQTWKWISMQPNRGIDPGNFARWKEMETCIPGHNIQTIIGE